MIRREFRDCPWAWVGYCIPAEHSTMKESPYTKATAAMAMEKQKRYEAKFRPLLVTAIKDIHKADSPARMSEIGSLAKGNLLTEEAALAEKGAKGLTGAVPNSGAMVMGRSALGDAAADATANAVFGSQAAQKDAELRALQNIVDIGNWKGSQAQASMTTLAGLSQDQAREALKLKLADEAGYGSALGTAAGLGAGAYLANRRAA